MNRIEFNGNKNIIFRSLKSARKRMKVTQSELAARVQAMGVNIDQRTVSKIEQNTRQVTDYEFACFCVALKIAPEELLKDFYDDNTV